MKTDEGFHNFLWTKEITPFSFRRVTSERKCVISEGLDYRVAHASYTAWLFPQTPSEDLVRIVTENPDLSKRTAVYDLSLLLEGERICPKINNTMSSVFREFEDFLEKKLHAKFEQLANHPIKEPETIKDRVSQFA